MTWFPTKACRGTSMSDPSKDLTYMTPKHVAQTVSAHDATVMFAP
jgi:hypothetical protein